MPDAPGPLPASSPPSALASPAGPEPIAIDRSAWGRIAVTGADRVRFLQGLTTVNVERLAPGAHAWGAILTPKGRVLAVIAIARPAEAPRDAEGADALLVITEAATAAPVAALLDRYAVMDDVAFAPQTGPAHQIWTAAEEVWSAPILEGAPPAGPRCVTEDDPAAERLRVRAGFPRYGIDVDDGHFPFETPLARFLDYTKGCYIGQEPVFRVHAQGNAAHALRGLVVAGAEPLARGTRLDAPAKGEVTSAIASGDQIWALAYLHRSSWAPGAEVAIGGRRATVHELPW
jgi:hypothetical protein